MDREANNQCFLDFFLEDDLAFYDRFLARMSDKELELFLREFPEFMRITLDGKESVFQKEEMRRNVFCMLRANPEKKEQK